MISKLILIESDIIMLIRYIIACKARARPVRIKQTSLLLNGARTGRHHPLRGNESRDCLLRLKCTVVYLNHENKSVLVAVIDIRTYTRNTLDYYSLCELSYRSRHRYYGLGEGGIGYLLTYVLKSI